MPGYPAEAREMHPSDTNDNLSDDFDTSQVQAIGPPIDVPSFVHAAGYEEGRRKAFEEVQAILIQPEHCEDLVCRALSLVTEYLTRPLSR